MNKSIVTPVQLYWRKRLNFPLIFLKRNGISKLLLKRRLCFSRFGDDKCFTLCIDPHISHQSFIIVKEKFSNSWLVAGQAGYFYMKMCRQIALGFIKKF